MPSRPALLRLPVTVAALGLAVLGLAGCTSAGGPPANAVAASSAAGAQAGATDPTPSPTAKPRTRPTKTKPIEVKLPATQEVAVVSAFGALNADPAVDTFYLSFDKPITGYSLRYVDAVTQDPSGKRVKLQGKAFLQLVVHGATTDNAPYVSGDTKPTKFGTPINFKPRMLAISEVRTVGDFESTLTFAIGVPKKGVPFKATLTDHGRHLDVDIAKPS